MRLQGNKSLKNHPPSRTRLAIHASQGTPNSYFAQQAHAHPMTHENKEL